MGLDMNLHKALEKLGEDVGTFGGGKARTEAEERDLGRSSLAFLARSGLAYIALVLPAVVSARIWLNCYLNDHTYVRGRSSRCTFSLIVALHLQRQLGNGAASDATG